MEESKTEEVRKIDLFFSFVCAMLAHAQTSQNKRLSRKPSKHS